MHRFFARLSHFASAALLPGLLTFIPVQEAKAQFGGITFCTNCSDEASTLVMQARQIMQYLQEVQTAVSTLHHLQIAVQEAKQLATHPSTNILQDLSMFSNVLQQSQGIALSLAQTDAAFRQNFQIYAPSPLTNYAAQYNTWAKTAMNSVHAAANSAGYQGNMLANEQQFMQQMNQLNQSPAGQDQAIQITNSIGLETVAQLQKLRMLFISNMSSNAAVSTSVMNAQQANITTNQNGFGHANWQADPTIY